ncbi:MAG: glycerol-3-phosphate dehydrogenase/oxidase [Thermoplasmataceae archaeon]|jgi:glycerol-3-phosphate dehydrogenase
MENNFSYITRKSYIEGTKNSDYDVAVIGGGIVGAGVINLLSQIGVKAILLEKNDFAAGTSSGSSKLIHGGLRYLAQMHIKLTRDLLRERNFLLKYDFLVKPVNFRILMDDYSWNRFELSLGLFMYNILGGHFKIPHMVKNKGEFDKSIRGYFDYLDAMTDDTTLVMHNILSAVIKGGICINHAEVVGLKEDKGLKELHVVDTLNNDSFTVKSKYIINAAGPWVNEVSEVLNLKKDEKFRLSRGTHIVVKQFEKPITNAIVFRSHIDGRQMFVIPREEVIIIGTTDVFVKSPEDTAAPEEEIDYIVKSVSRIYPSITRDSVLSTYWGIRPLYGSSSDPGKVSRDFKLAMINNIIEILGGKITDYGKVARKVAKIILKDMGKSASLKDKPEILYRRDFSYDNYDMHIMKECAITEEDLLRRAGIEIYHPWLRDQARKEIREALVRNHLS